MKKKIATILFFGSFAIATVWCTYMGKNQVNLLDINLANVTAIASSEGLHGCNYFQYKGWTGSLKDGNRITVCTGGGRMCCLH